MSGNKSRLFLFASFDKDGYIDDALVQYISKLSECGDIIFIMDNECNKSEIDKIKPYVIFAHAERHGEYDFGSYKRAYKYAMDNSIIDNYEYIYLVNDSAYGPIGGKSIADALAKLESDKCGFVGMLSNRGRKIPWHIQSWFVGIRKDFATSQQFKDFIFSVSHQDAKWDIITKYEFGLSELMLSLTNNNKRVLYEQNQDRCNVVWVKPWILIDNGIPFLKKIAIPKMFSYEFLKRILKNDTVFNEIKRRNPQFQHRPITYFWWGLFRKK